VVLPPEESIDSETAIENLIDTSDTGSLTGDQLDSVNTRNGSISPDALAERYEINVFFFLYYILSVLFSVFSNKLKNKQDNYFYIYFFINTCFFRDSLIDHLYQENVRQRQEVNHLLMDHQQIVADFRNRVLELESTLSTKVSAYHTTLIIPLYFVN